MLLYANYPVDERNYRNEGKHHKVVVMSSLFFVRVFVISPKDVALQGTGAFRGGSL